MKKLYLLCNAHLDPVWLWSKREGIAGVISSFRVAANFCEEYFDTPDKSKLPVIEKSLVHMFPGCYTSMIRIKQQNRLMENKLAVCEKMYAHMGETPDAEFEKAEKAQMLLLTALQRKSILAHLRLRRILQIKNSKKQI